MICQTQEVNNVVTVLKFFCFFPFPPPRIVNFSPSGWNFYPVRYLFLTFNPTIECFSFPPPYLARKPKQQPPQVLIAPPTEPARV